MDNDISKSLRLNYKDYLLIVLGTTLAYQLLWFIVDPFDWSEWRWYLFDVAYSASFSLTLTWICELLTLRLLRHAKSGHRVMSIAFMCLFVGIALSAVFEVVSDWCFGLEQSVVTVYGASVMALVAAMLITLLLLRRYLALYLWQVERSRKLELALLKRQLDPHFMYNSLNALSGYIGYDNEEGQRFLASFANIYRYITVHMEKDVVSIVEAVDFIDHYTRMLSMRHPGHFVVEVEPGLRSDHDGVLCMSLQLVTENAIKHNKHSRTRPLRVWYKREGDWLVVRNVIDRVAIQMPSAHRGLDNLQRRYELVSGRRCVIEDDGHIYCVKLPILPAGQDA